MSTLKQLAQKVLTEKNLKILPENIKKDLQIFNITGSFEGSGGIKLFETIEEMNQSTGNQDGDLAIVYDESSDNYQGIFEFEDNVWNIAETGLSATSRDVVSSVFQGKNGVEAGTLQVNTNISLDELKFKAQIYDNLSNLEFNSNVTDISNMFADRTDLVNIPTINLINITNMENTFLNCDNLSNDSYTKITNMLPNASNLTNQNLSNIGLNVSKFTDNQINILNSKGYLDAILKTKLTYYNIYYNTNDEV